MAAQQPLMSEKLHATLLLILENGCADAGNSGSSSPSKNHTSPLPLLERNLLETLVLLFCVLPEEVKNDAIAILYISNNFVSAILD